MYRPEYYGITNNEHGENIKGETLLRVAKHRNGALDTIKLKAELWCQKFVEPTVDNVISFNNDYTDETPF
jgi:replicative DNA helicase